jgi:hypothetical protein
LQDRRRAGRAATIYHISDLLHQGRAGDWPTAQAISRRLSVGVTVAA